MPRRPGPGSREMGAASRGLRIPERPEQGRLCPARRLSRPCFPRPAAPAPVAEFPSWGSGPGEEVGDVCARPREGAGRAGLGGRRREGGRRMHQAAAAVKAAAAAALQPPRRPLALPSPPRRASSPQARPRRRADGGRGSSAEDEEPGLGLIFKKKGEENGWKGAPRRSGKGRWEREGPCGDTGG